MYYDFFTELLIDLSSVYSFTISDNKPDYFCLRKMFRDLFVRKSFKYDFVIIGLLTST